MSKIYKYALGQNVNQVVEIKVLPSFKPLCARMQGADICIWGTCDNDIVASRTLIIAIVGTGRDIPMPREEWVYLSTVETPAKEIYHIFVDAYIKDGA